MAKITYLDGSTERGRSTATNSRATTSSHRASDFAADLKSRFSGFKPTGYHRNVSHSGTFTRTNFNITIGAVLFYGFFMNYLICKHMSGFFMSINPIVLLIGYIICVIIGGLMSSKSDNPIISFIGYNLGVLPVGAVLSVTLAGANPALILRAATVTAGVTAIMLLGAIAFPEIFRKMGRILFFALIAVIIVEVICMIFKVFMPTFWDFLVAALFALYIGYDWAIAQEYDCTLDNAIDACVGLYLNIVNLFMRIFSIMSRRD